MDRGAWWATVHGVAKSWTNIQSHYQTEWIPFTQLKTRKEC